MAVTDTSWLVALFNADDAHHGAAIRQAQQHSSILVPSPVLVEFLNGTRRRVHALHGAAAGRAAERDMLDQLEQTPAFRLEPLVPHKDASEVFRREPALSYVDGVAIVTALRERVTLLTFDEPQRQAWKKMASVSPV